MSEGKALTTRDRYEASVSKAEEVFSRLGLADKFVIESAYAKQIALANDSLYKCDALSIVQAIANVALTGLTLDPVRKLAFLIPRAGKCILQPSYRGLIKSVTSTGSVVGFEAKVVYKGDFFEFEEGSNPFLKHKSLDLKEDITEEEIKKIELRKKDPFGQMVCVYSVAIMQDGSRSFVVVPKWRVEKSRSVAKGIDKYSSPWKQWPEEQIRKTALAYHAKTLDIGDAASSAVQLYHDNEGIDLNRQSEAPPIEYISEAQVMDIDCMLSETNADATSFFQYMTVKCKVMIVDSAEIPSEFFNFAVKVLEAKRGK